MQYEFQTLPNDFFQPEHIFHLDQPIRTDFPAEPDKSPTTVLDLGSGTIQQSSFKVEPSQEQMWEFQTSPVKQESNPNAVDMQESFPLHEENYNNAMCGIQSNDDFPQNPQYYKSSNVESSCRFQYTSNVHQIKDGSNHTQNVPHYAQHACSEGRISSENVDYSGYSGDMLHYEEKFPETTYSHCDPFSDIDISQLDYSGKGVYSNVSSIENGGIMEEETVFHEFPANQNEHDSRSCYSQSSFQSYMFLPQH